MGSGAGSGSCRSRSGSTSTRRSAPPSSRSPRHPGVGRSWALLWQRDGLSAPAVVAEATDTYATDSDVLADFIHECCTVDPDAELTGSCSTVPTTGTGAETGAELPGKADQYRLWTQDQRAVQKAASQCRNLLLWDRRMTRHAEFFWRKCTLSMPFLVFSLNAFTRENQEWGLNPALHPTFEAVMYGLDGRHLHTRIKGRDALTRRLTGLLLACHRFAKGRAATPQDRSWAAKMIAALEQLLQEARR